MGPGEDEGGRRWGGFPMGGGVLGSRPERTHVQDDSGAPTQRGGARAGAGVYGGGVGGVRGGGDQRHPGLAHPGAHPAQQPAQRPALLWRLPQQPVRAGPAQARRPLAHRAAPATARKPADPRPPACGPPPRDPLPGAAGGAAPPSLLLPPRPRPPRGRAGAGGPGGEGCALRPDPEPRAWSPPPHLPWRPRAAAEGCPRGC